MHGIYLAAVLTTAIAIALFGALIHRLRFTANERLLWLAALIALPLQPLAFYFVRVPLDNWLEGRLVHGSATYLSLISLHAPVTEEAAKLLPLLVPAISARRTLPATLVQLLIGAGFLIFILFFFITWKPKMM